MDLLTTLVIAIAATLLLSGLCSILEAMLLSTTTAEIEALKKQYPWRGEKLDLYKAEIDETSSAILSLNTIANTLGATMVGGLAAQLFGEGSRASLVYFPIGMTLGILLFSEVIPKNAGVIYRPKLQPILIFPLYAVRLIMTPVSRACGTFVRWILPRPVDSSDPDQEILLLAERRANEGDLTEHEHQMITNALHLDEVLTSQIMTPRTVVTALQKDQTVDEVLVDFRNIPFARLPVYDETIDQVTGVVRRRDILTAKADGDDETRIADLQQDALFIPENASGAAALQTFLHNHQQIAIVVDEYGSVAGVVTMEDIIEYLLGQEIFEHDDVAVDMRELAMRQREKKADKKPPSASSPARK